MITNPSLSTRFQSGFCLAAIALGLLAIASTLPIRASMPMGPGTGQTTAKPDAMPMKDMGEMMTKMSGMMADMGKMMGDMGGMMEREVQSAPQTGATPPSGMGTMGSQMPIKDMAGMTTKMSGMMDDMGKMMDCMHGMMGNTAKAKPAKEAPTTTPADHSSHH